MDANGTRFQLLKGKADWLAGQEFGQPNGTFLRLAWDDGDEFLTLNPLLSLFVRGTRDAPLDPAARRGAAADRFGNWFWIAHDRQRIYWQPSGSGKPLVYWSPTSPACPGPVGQFGPLAPVGPSIADLAGLAVTEDHYLVVGNLTQRGLYRFDLHAGGEPTLLLFPEGAPFEPFDLAARPGGGVWILDRTHRAYWGLDREFQVIVDPASGPGGPCPEGETPAFHPVGSVAQARPIEVFPSAFAVSAMDPISIEALPDGSVLILDRQGQLSPGDPAPASTLLHYRYGQLIAPPLRLAATVEVASLSTGATTTELAVTAHDIAYSAADKTLYVVDWYGKQTIAFGLDFESPPSPGPGLTVKSDYLPMHYFGGRAIARHAQKVFYDVVGGDPARDPAVRWIALQTIDEPRYDRAATLQTPVFDGKTHGCVWDRLDLDACIPADTAVAVSTRASDDSDLLLTLPFTPEPSLYLRGNGSEIPLYEAFPNLSAGDDAGTWELLFQTARGRYLQVQLALSGNGRATPKLRALRAYYPRYSYPRQYLPAVYQDDPSSASFLERLLANPEGFFTLIEDQMNLVGALFDPRCAPSETLDWLAGWLGLVLDPIWSQIQARRQTVSASSSQPAPDRRRLFIRYAIRLYKRRGTPDGIRFALHLLLDPCLEQRLQRLKNASVAFDPALAAELSRLGLPYPTPVMTDEEFEDLLHDYLLAPARPSQIRLVERFMTRNGRAAVAGDTSAAGQNGADTIAATAHQFSVLVAETLSAEEAAMVDRIANLEKPAHTAFDVRRFWDGFRVGEARVGIDTVVGASGSFREMILGRDYLAEGYLYPAPPMNVPNRLIANRDRIGRAHL